MKAKHLSLFTYFTFKESTDFFFLDKKSPLLISKILTEIWSILTEACHHSVYNESFVCVEKRQKNQTNLTITKKKKNFLYYK